MSFGHGLHAGRLWAILQGNVQFRKVKLLARASIFKSLPNFFREARFLGLSPFADLFHLL